MLQAFQSRDFRLLWSGQAVSLLGDSAFLIALNWRTFTLTGSAKSIGIVLTFQGVGLLSTVLVGGALADRYDRRKLMLISDAARCAIIAALAVLDATGHISIEVLAAVAFVEGLATGFFAPALGGLVPLIVEGPHARLGQRADRHGAPGQPADRPFAWRRSCTAWRARPSSSASTRRRTSSPSG